MDYSFYTDVYKGEDIPEADFARCLARAEAELGRIRDAYPMAARPGYTEESAESMALCAIAEAAYEFDGEDAARRLSAPTRVAVGSVSETYAAPPELCATTLALRAAHYRHEAGYYYRIGRWVYGA